MINLSANIYQGKLTDTVHNPRRPHCTQNTCSNGLECGPVVMDNVYTARLRACGCMVGCSELCLGDVTRFGFSLDYLSPT